MIQSLVQWFPKYYSRPGAVARRVAQRGPGQKSLRTTGLVRYSEERIGARTDDTLGPIELRCTLVAEVWTLARYYRVYHCLSLEQLSA